MVLHGNVGNVAYLEESYERYNTCKPSALKETTKIYTIDFIKSSLGISINLISLTFLCAFDVRKNSCLQIVVKMYSNIQVLTYIQHLPKKISC